MLYLNYKLTTNVAVTKGQTQGDLRAQNRGS